ncbi:uncharacterized protein DMENIID0001_094720 [Sergentomyia squamirostris]
MEFSTDWSIDGYRAAYECDEHWDLRKRFMEAHKESFPEEELVCLAQTFTNVEFMGCRYPAETMRMIAELSKDVAKDFRKERESRLKRTFVGAKDAAEAKVKKIRK